MQLCSKIFKTRCSHHISQFIGLCVQNPAFINFEWEEPSAKRSPQSNSPKSQSGAQNHAFQQFATSIEGTYKHQKALNEPLFEHTTTASSMNSVRKRDARRLRSLGNALTAHYILKKPRRSLHMQKGGFYGMIFNGKENTVSSLGNKVYDNVSVNAMGGSRSNSLSVSAAAFSAEASREAVKDIVRMEDIPWDLSGLPRRSRKLLNLEKVMFVSDANGNAPGVLLLEVKREGIHRDGPSGGSAVLMYNIGEHLPLPSLIH
jgi:hypothetical protein